MVIAPFECDQSVRESSDYDAKRDCAPVSTDRKLEGIEMAARADWQRDDTVVLYRVPGEAPYGDEAYEQVKE